VTRPAPSTLYRVVYLSALGFPTPYEWIERNRILAEPAWRDQLLAEIADCPSHMLLVSVEETACDWSTWTQPKEETDE